tara:strand:- start:633 stop:863 length:231 start_codon:yes stop_codon:yes gene_type:complete
MVEGKKLDKWRKYELNAECKTVELFHDDFIDDLEADTMSPAWRYLLLQMGIDIADFDAIESLEIKIDTVKINTNDS